MIKGIKLFLLKCHFLMFQFFLQIYTEKNRSYDLGQRSTDIKPYNLDYKI